jgi:hypothetical protein
MRNHLPRILLILISLAIINPVLADQKIKTKSNIKNDRVQQPATNADCVGEACAAVVDCVKQVKEEGTTKDVDQNCDESQQAHSSAASDKIE